MASNVEGGYAKTVANQQALTAQLIAIGPAYNPAGNEIKIPNLTANFTASTAIQNAIIAAEPPYKFAVDAREALFAPQDKFLTRLRRFYPSVDGVGTKEMENLDTLLRKYKGERKKAKKSTDPVDPLLPMDDHSVSKRSYDQLTNTMAEIVALLAATPGYSPNEDDFKIATLEATQVKLLQSTKDVEDSYAPLSTLRTERLETLYGPGRAVDTANKARNYALSITEKSSPIYKAIMRITFRKPGNK